MSQRESYERLSEHRRPCEQAGLDRVTSSCSKALRLDSEFQECVLVHRLSSSECSLPLGWGWRQRFQGSGPKGSSLFPTQQDKAGLGGFLPS